MKKATKFNQEVEATITASSHDGRGITHIDGKTTFVSGALPNERVRLRYLKRRSQLDEAFTTEILHPSPERIPAKCQHFGTCGGCSLQHITSHAQIKLKEKTLLEQLQHFAHTHPEEILPLLAAEQWGYRNKARLGVKHVPGKHKVLIGFREKMSRYLADLSRCEILHPSVGMHLTDFSQLLGTLEKKDKIPQIEIARDDFSTALIIRHLEALPASDIEKILTFAKEFNYKIYLQPKGIDSIQLIYPENDSPLMQYSLPDYKLTLEFHPAHFTQINSSINQLMIAQALKLLEINPKDEVLDLFCGIGNFTLPLATQSASVIGVEGDEFAVNQARANAKNNNLTNTCFHVQNLFEPPFANIWSQRKFSKLLIDPPRSGALEALSNLKQWQPERIVYVSCNPATLARDSAIIIENGYTLKKAGVLDMFPHTQHVESMALFIRR